MITKACCRPLLSPSFVLPRGQARWYAQQRTARTPRSAAQASTTNPSPTSQLKNRTLPPTASSAAGVSSAPSARPTGSAPVVPKSDGQAFHRVRQAVLAREMEQSGQQLEMLRMSMSSGMDPWSSKAMLMDLRIPSKPTSFRALRDNWRNSIQNILSMFRLATDFAFPGVLTKWRIHPQLFRTKSTRDNGWVAPYRQEMLDAYIRINQAIASGDSKTLTKLTAYEYQEHAVRLLHRSMARASETKRTYTWSLNKLISPVRIVSLRAYPLYHGAEEPKYGNRNCVQAVARFETMQTLTIRNARGQVLRPDATVAEEGYTPEPRRVLEYLLFENKMFYRDGWYVRDQMFEGVKPKFREIALE
ncbi:hypothetical protein M0805_002109 [Coniferiporia weirii]|nr:hypothetical protein M0805_002109 [Coniferiporia weirii]